MPEDEPKPVEAVSVSPSDKSSDRVQSDADNAEAVSTAKRATEERGRDREQAGYDQVAVIDKFNELIASNNKVHNSSDRMAVAMVEYQERARKAAFRYRTTILVIIIGFVVLYFRQSASNDKVLQIGKDNQKALDSAQASRLQIADCIKPTGTCYKDSQKRTGAAIISLERIVVVADVCAINYATQDLTQADRLVKVNACVEKEITK